MDQMEIARLLDADRTPIVSEAVASIMQIPFFAARFAGIGRKRMMIDMDANFAAVIKAIRYRSPMILDDHIVWRRNMLIERHCSTGIVRRSFEELLAVIATRAPEDSLPLLREYFDSAAQALVYPGANIRHLAAAHEQLAEDLTVASYDNHWEWQAAYQADGRARALDDIWWCIDYLVDALGGDSPAILGNHLRWMRDRMIERGLATIHLRQLLWFLTDVVDRRLPPGPAGDARRMLEQSAELLDYDRKSCRALLAVQEHIIAEAAGRLAAEGLTLEEGVEGELGWCLSYLYDCLASDDPASLLRYTSWMRYWLKRIDLPDAALLPIYQALEQSIRQVLPEPIAAEANALLDVVQQALREPYDAAPAI